MALNDTSLNTRSGYNPMPIAGNDTNTRGQTNTSKPQNFLDRLWENVEDYFTGKHSQARDYMYDQLKMDRQEAFEKEMWEKTNAYNSPAQQLARWKEAGGNPNAFFGGGTNTGNASMAPAPTGGGAAGSTIGVLGNSVGTAVNAAKAYWETMKTKAEAEGKQMENGTYMRRTEAEIQQTIAATTLAAKQGNLADWQAKQIEDLLPGLVGKTNAEIDEIKQRTWNLLDENEFIKERTKNLKEDTAIKIKEKEKLKWEKLFRDQYGVDPNTGPMQMLIQNILSGKGVNVLQTIWGYFEGDYGVDEFVDKLQDKKHHIEGTREYQKGKALQQQLLFHNPGLIGAYYSAKKLWGRNKRKRESNSHSFKF